MVDFQRVEIAKAVPLKDKPIEFLSATATDASTAITTVATGTVFYLVAAGLSMHSTADGSVSAVVIDGTMDSLLLMEQAATNLTATNCAQVNTMSYPQPIPLVSGTIISVYSDNAGTKAYGWVIGWEE